MANQHFWPDALCEYFEGLLKGEDRLYLIAPWGHASVAEVLGWHKLEPLSRELYLSGPCPLPEFEAPFQAERIRHLFKADIVQGQLQEIESVFRENKIEFLVLKGPLWAEHIYPSALWRHLGDIDLLIEPENLDLAIHLLVDIGYTFYRGLTPDQYLGREGEVAFQYPDEKCKGRTTVELHWHPINAHKPKERRLRGRLAVAYEDFFRESKPVPFHTCSFLLPRPEVWFAYQIIHGISQHHLERLLPVADLAYILRRYPQFDFRFLLELMGKWKALVPLSLGLKTLWLFGLRDGPHLEILERLDKVMPWRVRSFSTSLSPKRLLLAYAGKGWVMRKFMRLVSTMPSAGMVF